MEFMRDALSGKKKLLTNRDLCPVTVPRYKEFNSTNLEALAFLAGDRQSSHRPEIEAGTYPEQVHRDERGNV